MKPIVLLLTFQLGTLLYAQNDSKISPCQVPDTVYIEFDMNSSNETENKLKDEKGRKEFRFGYAKPEIFVAKDSAQEIADSDIRKLKLFTVPELRRYETQYLKCLVKNTKRGDPIPIPFRDSIFQNIYIVVKNHGHRQSTVKMYKVVWVNVEHN